MKEKLLLIDGHSILSRAFYGIPMLTNSQGIHTNAVYGFLNIMFKVIDEEKADHLAVAFDLSRKTFRNGIYEAYKGTRKPMPEELHEQIPILQEVLRAMNIPILTMEQYEADDILGTVAKRSAKEGISVTVLSGDRDLLQLAEDDIKISIPKTSKGRTEVFQYYPADVKAEYGVTPLEFIDMKALMGDASDNIPGVPSIGEKTARAIIEQYHSIENAYAHADEITPPRAKKAFSEHYDMAQMSKTLATIVTDVPVDFSFSDAAVADMYNEAALKLIKQLEFKTIAARFPAAGSAHSEALSLDGLKLVTDAFLAEIVLKDALSESSFSLVLFAEACGEVPYAQHADGEAPGGGNGNAEAAAAEEPQQLSLFELPKEAEERALSAEEPRRKTCAEYAAAGLCLSKDRLYVLRSSEAYPAAQLLSDLCRLLTEASKKGIEVSTLKLKQQLPYLCLRRSAQISDLSIAAYLLNPLKDSYDYDDLARDYLGISVPGRTELLGKTDVLHALFSEAGGEEAKAACDAAKEVMGYASYITYLAAKPVKKKLRETKMLSLFTDIEMPLIYSLSDMEEAGIRTDSAALSEYAALLKEKLDLVEREIHEETGESFNLNSPQQLGAVLFEKMGIKGGKKTKTGYSTAADVLNKLAPEYPVVAKILRYRAISKLYSTYAVGLSAFIRADGRIHGTFHQTITATGRISSTDPNLQNIPVRTAEGKEIRKVFIPVDGYVFVDADYSQVELRILAALSGDEKLINAYRDAVDIHTLTASEVFHVPLSEVTPEMRRNAKAVNFGIVYGISAFGLGEGLSISRKEAQEYIDKYFETYPGVKRYLDEQVASAKEKGYVRTAFGRIRPIPELKSSNFMQRSFGERVAMNSPIQGTAADIMKIAMNKINMALSGLDANGMRVKPEMKSRIVLQVHDELLIETAPEELPEVKAMVKRLMEEAAELSVKLSVDVQEGVNWYDCH